MGNTKFMFFRLARLFGLFTFLVFLGFSISSFACSSYDCCVVDSETPLIIKQNIVVGKVIITADESNIYVIYQTTGNWYMSETHLAVATQLDLIPLINKNPAPNKFKWQATHNPPVNYYEYTIPIRDIPNISMCTDRLYFVAHACVCNNIPTIPSGTAKFTVSLGINNGRKSYLLANLTSGLVGKYQAYCLESDVGIFPGENYTSALTSSYDPNVYSITGFNLEDLRLVNYIVN